LLRATFRHFGSSPRCEDYLVSLVKQGDAGVQVGHEHLFLPVRRCRRGRENRPMSLVLPFHVEPLETLVGSITYGELGYAVTSV